MELSGSEELTESSFSSTPISSSESSSFIEWADGQVLVVACFCLSDQATTHT